MSRRARAVGSVLALLVLGLLLYLVGPGTDGSSPTATTTASPAPRATATSSATRDPGTGLPLVALTSLPGEARQTVALIDRGGPFPYRQDGSVFANQERRLPAHTSGWYREYTVHTPGSEDRGARRLITGGDGRLLFWTADHYASFAVVQR